MNSDSRSEKLINKFKVRISQLAGSESCINPDLFSLVYVEELCKLGFHIREAHLIS